MSIDAPPAAAAAVLHTSRSIRVVSAAVLSVMAAGVLLAARWALVSDATAATVVFAVVTCYTVLAAIPLVAVMLRLDRAVAGTVSESMGTGPVGTGPLGTGPMGSGPTGAGATIYPFPTIQAKVS